ncbi:MAG: sulfite exporter TauE/SafE family protein [Alphaproteobacteria bacterium]|nr:sulfite exporter TauE/SafE family protein [Alphaproteobacteria bacterium]
MTFSFGFDAFLLLMATMATGAFAGFVAGLLGVGGGIVIVPVLYHLLEFVPMDPALRMHVAVGTSLATLIPTSIRSVGSHRKRGAVDDGLLHAWRIPLALGVLAGGALAGIVSRQALVGVFATVALVVSLHMAFGREGWRIGERLPDGLAGRAMAGVIGLLSTLMGIGGGTLGVPLLTLFGYPIHRAVGTGAGLGLIIGIPGTILFAAGGLGAGPALPAWSIGYVNLVGFLAIVPMTIWLAPYGVKAAHALSRAMLRRAFALFLGVTAIKLYADLLGFSVTGG